MCRRVCKQKYGAARGQKLSHYLQTFGVEFGAHDAYAGNIRARTSHIRDEFCSNKIFRHGHNGNRIGRSLDGEASSIAEGCNHGRALRHEFDCECRQTVYLAVGIANIKRDVATFHVAQRLHIGAKWFGESTAGLLRKNKKNAKDGRAGCCAPATSGQVAALPMSVMNSRRLIVAPEAQVRTSHRTELRRIVGRVMSALGHLRTFHDDRALSALLPKADMQLARVASAVLDSGNVKRNSAPPPGRFSAHILPSKASTIVRAIDRPRPVPWPLVE